MQCPLCQTEDSRSLVPQQTEKTIFHCATCDALFKSPDLYLNWNQQQARYSLHQNDIEDKGYISFFEQLLTPLRPFLGNRKWALDWGSGPGEKPVLGELLKREGLQVDLYDPIYRKEIPNRKYELITSTEVLEHFQEPVNSLTQIFDLLEPQGIFAGMTLFHSGPESYTNWWYKNDPTHVIFYSEKTFQWMAHNRNLEIQYLKSPVFIFKKR